MSLYFALSIVSWIRIINRKYHLHFMFYVCCKWKLIFVKIPSMQIQQHIVWNIFLIYKEKELIYSCLFRESLGISIVKYITTRWFSESKSYIKKLIV